MKYTKEYLEKLVKESKTMWELIEKTNTMKKTEGNHHYISKLIRKYNIDTKHFVKNYKRENKSLSEYLVKGKYLTLNGNRFKNKLYQAGLKTPICEECGQNENWRGKKISLILDHIDGDRENNELNNLRILCPNCNATLDTHCGKNISRDREEAISPCS